MSWHRLLRKAWVVIRSFGCFLGLFKGRQAGWIWKMLVLTHTHTPPGIPSLQYHWPADYWFWHWCKSDWRIKKGQKNITLLFFYFVFLSVCLFFCLCYPFHLSLTSYMHWNSIGDWNYSGSPQDTELQINSAHDLIIWDCRVASSIKPWLSIMRFLQ